MDIPIMVSQMATPTNLPANQSKTIEQMQYMHKRYPAEFPHLNLFQLLIKRVESIESGLATEEDMAPFNQDE